MIKILGRFKCKVSDATTPRQEYDAALEESRVASRKFMEIQKKYRAREIGDTEYLAGRKAHDLAMKKFDEAEAQYRKATKNGKIGDVDESLEAGRERNAKFQELKTAYAKWSSMSKNSAGFDKWMAAKKECLKKKQEYDKLVGSHTAAFSECERESQYERDQKKPMGDGTRISDYKTSVRVKAADATSSSVPAMNEQKKMATSRIAEARRVLDKIDAQARIESFLTARALTGNIKSAMDDLRQIYTEMERLAKKIEEEDNEAPFAQGGPPRK